MHNTIMLLTRSSVLIFLLSTHNLPHTIAHGQISCFYQDPPQQALADCRAAINLIPNGVKDLHLDPTKLDPLDKNERRPISLYRRPSSSQRKYFLPAAFHSGSCMVLVRSAQQHGARPEPPEEKLAYAMYFKLWPNVRRMADRILRICPRQTPENHSWFGGLQTWTWLQRWQFWYYVTVRWAPTVTARDGEKMLLDWSGVEYTVYQAA